MSNNENTNNTNTAPETAYEVVKHKKKKWPAILGICLAGAAAAIALPVIFLRAKTVNLSEYVTVVYDGISGYATPKPVVDTEGLYSSLAGEEKNAEKLESYKNFADSVAASVTGEKVANGEDLEVNVTFNEELRKNSGYKVSDEKFTITAEGIDPGKSVNLFQDASIDITGISPDAVLKVENKSSDEYLKTLLLYADKETVANGDEVILKCDVTDDELAAHGFIAQDMTALYEVKGLSEYITEGDINKSIADKITEEGKSLIETETQNDTYRMIYKLTNNAEYLTLPNTETAEDTRMEEMYLLKRRSEADKVGNPENLIISFYKSVLKVQDRSETGYFAFIYPDSFVTADGKVEINSDNIADTVQMNTDVNALKNTVLQSKEGEYEVVRIDTASLSDEAVQESATTVTEEVGS